MRVAEDDPGAHPDELVDEEETALEHLLEDEHGAVRLRRRHDRDRGQVGRERGPGAVLDLRDLAAEVVLDLEPLARRDAHGRLPHLDLDAEPRERRQDREQIPGLDVLDRDVAAGGGREADEAADLDVLGSDAPVAAVQLGDAVDAEDVRLDPLDLGAERDEEAAEVLDVRLAGGVADHRLALGEHRRHDDVLGRHHARLVEEDRLAAQPRRAHLEAAVDLDLDAELGEAVDVRVEPATPDHVAAGRRHDRGAEAREQRTGEQEGRADAAAQLLVELGLVHPGRVDPDLVLAEPVGVGTDVDQELDHRLHVADAGHVRQLHRLRGEHRGGQDRQRTVLVSGGTDGATERFPALDDEGLHLGG